MPYYAHSLEGKPPEEWQPLEVHLRNVAEKAAEFAGVFRLADWGYTAGLWHDLGKYSEAFQHYLRNSTEASAETLPGRVDHATAGAQYAVEAFPLLGHLLAYCIAGHHSGLLDGQAVGANQRDRLAKAVQPWRHGLAELPRPATPVLPGFVRTALGDRDAFIPAFFTRMVFSCLVDADFLDTERFIQGAGRADARSGFPALGSLTESFFQSLEVLDRDASPTEVNCARRAVREACEKSAEQAPGFFSLTVPTGGGKTLSSMAFALRHAAAHGLRRVIYVAPFTSIIEQNAAVFRRHLGEAAVLEHHSNLDPERETESGRLASENWDAPVIVTTAVQFYEALFACKTSRARRLHRLARSVVILDEAQTLPVSLLHPCLRALRELCDHYGATVVLCTATQPEIKRRPEFAIGLAGVREIAPDPQGLYERLRRVEVRPLGMMADAELAARLSAHPRALCIVNTTRHARALFVLLGADEGHFHLSARMCPAHRKQTLDAIRDRLGQPDAVCRVVSTQVVEAGVDVDFPVVYRALAGLDSIAQAAGRCNRNGLLKGLGEAYVFQTEHRAANRYFEETANCAAQTMARHEDDPLALQAIARYFQLYYLDQRTRWDQYDILGQFRLDGAPGSSLPFDLGFATAAERFRLIDDTAQRAVIVPWGERGKELCAKLRAMPKPNRETIREAQRFTVNVRLAEWNRAVDRKDVRLLFDDLGVLESMDAFYDENTGLDFNAEGPGAYFA